ncbi:MAG TPA: Ldh family oxidoreductase [Tepidimicrobium sp.]|nr:Ldh family oxidoreductase [Tepidimicrobium sp.]
MLYVKKQTLHKFVQDVFMKVGLKTEDASLASEVIVQADYSGVGSHGIARLTQFVTRIRKGAINKNPRITQINDSDNLISLDGDNGSGIVIGPKALKLCIERAKEHGIACVTLNNSNHYGVGNYYAWKFAEANLIGLTVTNTSPCIAPFGGIEKLFGTNPLTIAIPANKHYPIVLDMATSKVAYGQIERRAIENQKIPMDWAIDKEGNPTDSPLEALKGSLLHFGGYKGYGIALIIDILSSILAQANYGKGLGNVNDFENPKPEKIGHFMMAIDISRFQPIERFKNEVDKYIDSIKNSKRAPGVEEIFVPGEIEFLKAKENAIKGIAITENMGQILLDLAIELELAGEEDNI